MAERRKWHRSPSGVLSERAGSSRHSRHPNLALAVAAAALVVTLWILGIVSLFASGEFGGVPPRGGSSLRAASGGTGPAASSASSGESAAAVASVDNAPAPVLLSRSPTVSINSDVRGNLGPASVLNQDPPGTDWIKDRWQAASDMHGSAIKGAHWVLLDFGRDARIGVTRVVLDWEAAHAEDYRVEVGVGSSRGKGGGGGDGDGDGDEDGRQWTVLYDGSNAEHRRRLRSVEESGQSPGVKNKTPLHVMHTLGPFVPAGEGGRFLRVWIRKPARGWGVSLWQVDVFGNHLKK